MRTSTIAVSLASVANAASPSGPARVVKTSADAATAAMSPHSHRARSILCEPKSPSAPFPRRSELGVDYFDQLDATRVERHHIHHLEHHARGNTGVRIGGEYALEQTRHLTASVQSVCASNSSGASLYC